MARRTRGTGAIGADELPSRRRFGLALGALTGLWLVIFLLAPLAILVAWSFQTPGMSIKLGPASLEAYRFTFSVASYWRLLAWTAVTALIVALVAVVLAYPIAYVLALIARKRRYLLLGIAFVPYLTSYLLRIFAWRLLLGSKGLLNTVLVDTGLLSSPVRAFLFSRTAVVIVLIYVWVPWAALPIFVRLEQMDRALMEAGSDLGAKPAHIFLRITLPLSFPGILTALFFVFIPTLGDFATASYVGGASGLMFGNVIQTFLTTLNYPSGSVLAVVLLLGAFVTMVLAAKLLKVRDVGDVRI
jgi:spermidine/putrescine transport system permease protein